MENWKTIRSEYEIMHTSVQELAKSHHVGESLIQHAIESEGWKRLSVEDTDVEGFSNKLHAMNARNDMMLVPKFIQLQGKLLDKCDKLLDGVEKIGDAADLKIVSEVLEKHRPDVLANQGAGAGDSDINIRIMTHAGAGETPSISTVEVSPSASKVNGIGPSDKGLTKVQ